jgi:heterodisulfide reductase subunit A2
LTRIIASPVVYAPRDVPFTFPMLSTLESIISRVNDQNCDGCAFCVDACSFQAITLFEYRFEGKMKKTVDVNGALYKGCGSCMATCPKMGIEVAGFTLDQLGAQVDAALGIA